MNTLYENIEKIVAKIEGPKIGNAFLVDENRAVTVKHCIENPFEKVKLVFPKIQESGPVDVWAAVDERFNQEEDELLLLKLEQELPQMEISIAVMTMHPSDEAKVFGYDRNYLATGRWTDVISAASAIPNSEIVQDMLFDVQRNRESDFSGLSGSPIVKGNYIIGIVSQETLEKSQAISIHGISAKSCYRFWERYGIRVTDLSDVGGFFFEPNLSIGSYRSSDRNIAIGGEQGLRNWVHGKYSEKLEEIVSLHRRGDIESAWDELRKQIMELDRNLYIGNDVKGEYYYRMALWFLEDKRDIRKAQKKYEKAVELKPDLDGCIYLALKQMLTGERTDAEELLEPVDTISKFNVYLQLCINARKLEKAYNKYEELDQVIPMDDTTYYLLSIMETLQQEYDIAMRHIEDALEVNEKMSAYHMVKGIILYWKAIPKDVCRKDDFYPVLFSNGLLHLEEEQCQMMKNAGMAFHRAFKLADTIGNKGMEETILSIWINTLSADSSFQNDVLEPLQLLKGINPFNATALLYMIKKRMKLPEDVTIATLEQYLKRSQNKIGYVIILIELCILQDNKKDAKKFLHEYRSLFFKGQYYAYWYEYIVKVEDNKEKLIQYEGEIKDNAELDEILRKRLLCLFWQLDADKDAELQKILSDIYKQSQERVDLLNLIFFSKTRRKWQNMLQYAERLSEQYRDIYGDVYKMQSLVELGAYDSAIKVIAELRERQVAGTEEEILRYEIVIYERQGRYAESIEAGKKLLQRNISEQLFLKLSSLYVLDGDETNALNILLRAEENGIATVAVCQRISTCYLAIDRRKAWEYAVKAVKLSKDKPEVMLWATDIANRTGRSDKAGEYLHNIMLDNQTHQLLMPKSIDEFVEMVRVSIEETEKNIQMLHKGELPSHTFVDSYRGNQTYAEFFYRQWDNAEEMQSNEIVPMEFGAHYYDEDELPSDMKRIVLDYSSCLFLQEMNLLEILCADLEQIYVAGDLFGIISEELRKLPVRQSDLIRSKYDLVLKCKNELNVKFVESKLPIDIEEMEVKQRTDAIQVHTAKSYGAVWVSDDGAENSIREIEVIAVLYRDGQIERETFEAYAANVMSAREDKIESLHQGRICMLVDWTVLERWNDFYLLSIVCERFDVLAEMEMMDTAIRDYEQIAVRKHICERLGSLKTNLLDLKDQGKLMYLPVEEYHDGMEYSNMLISLMIAAEMRNLPMCVDDRVITSYSHVGKAPIYNTFDLMRILYLKKKIGLEKYSSLWIKALNKKISYVLPDYHFMLNALQLSEVDYDKDRLKESGMLSKIRKYVVTALSQGSFLSHEKIEHVHIPEWDYFIFHLQGQSRDLFRSVWRSDMDYQKMCLASEWILCHYSQFAFDFSDTVDVRRKECHAIQLADFLIEGLMIALDEERTEQYYKWMYGWFSAYLEMNPGIKEKALKYTKEYIVSYLRKVKRERNKQEIDLVEWMFATGIYYMPDEYKVYILEDGTISNMYNSIYCEMSVVLAPERQVPATMYKTWEKDVLAMEEKTILVKNYKDVNYHFSWEYILPAFPGVNITWEENSMKKTKRMFMERGCRLKHEDKNVRKKELQSIDVYLEEFEYRKQNFVLKNMGQYKEVAEEILRFLDMSERYEELRIECGLRNEWLNREDTRNLMLPLHPDYFKKLYDFEVNPDISTVVKEQVALALPVHFGEIGFESQEEHHNPVRMLHSLALLLSTDAREEDIIMAVENLFSCVDEKEGKYGYIYIVLLKVIWHLFSEMDNYKNEAYENRLIWTYIWADKILACLVKMEDEDKLDVEVYTKQLEKGAGIDIKIDGLWDSTENEDVLSPVNMNLYKLCVTGTLVICSCYESRMRLLSQVILGKLNECYGVWISVPIYYREAELLHQNEKNSFNAAFTENCYFLIERLRQMGNCKSKISIRGSYVVADNRMKNMLQGILEGLGVDMPELIYLFIITRENMEKIYVDMIKEIIEKQVLGAKLHTDPLKHRLLAYIVSVLPLSFQKEYVEHEFTRVGALLHTREIQWEEAYNLVVEIIQISDYGDFFIFWEKYADELDEFDALQMAELIGRVQLTMPLEYAERTRDLRILLEMKS